MMRIWRLSHTLCEIKVDVEISVAKFQNVHDEIRCCGICSEVILCLRLTWMMRIWRSIHSLTENKFDVENLAAKSNIV